MAPDGGGRSDMKMQAWPIAAVVLAAAAACAAQTQPPQPYAPQVQLANAGDAAQGRAYAQSACASCHAIETGQMMSPVSIAPPFEELANTPGMTAIAVRAWLNSPHENMPQLIVGPEDADDLSAYILSLKHRSE
jgi:mono/diheme cytochrome c family protein